MAGLENCPVTGCVAGRFQFQDAFLHGDHLLEERIYNPLQNTSVLLMDEATAALDEITANAIMNSVLAMKNITCITVTHRLDESILKKYDEIIVLNHGKVAEQGTFDALISRHGLFYSLYTVSQ